MKGKRNHASVLALTAALLGVTATGSMAPATVSGQGQTAADPLRTSWGEPNLQGIWNGQTLTPLERPKRFAGKAVLTEAEATQLAKEVNSRPGRQARLTGEKDVAGAYNEFWLTGATKFTDLRTSLIVDPPDGKMPPYTAATQKRLADDRELRLAMLKGQRRTDFPAGYNNNKLNRSDGPEDRGLSERCLGGNLPDWGGSGIGAYFQIVQSPKTIAIFYDTGQGQGFNRVIPVDGSPHLPSNVRLWWGDSRAHWEGNTLVVDTTNFTNKVNIRGARENLHLIERFTRASADRLNYQVTLDDPTTWTKPWTVLVSWPKESEKENHIFEPTCHVGNHGMVGMLSGARADEKAFSEGRGPDPFTLDRYTGGDGVGQPSSASIEGDE